MFLRVCSTGLSPCGGPCAPSLQRMTASTAAPRQPSPRGHAALGALYLVLSTLTSLLVGDHGQGVSGALWSPPAGLAFGLLLLTGWRSAWVVLIARVTGGLLTAPADYAAAPAATENHPARS